MLPSSRIVIALSVAIRRTVYTDIEMVAAVVNIRNLSYHIDVAAYVFMSGMMWSGPTVRLTMRSVVVSIVNSWLGRVCKSWWVQ